MLESFEKVLIIAVSFYIVDIKASCECKWRSLSTKSSIIRVRLHLAILRCSAFFRSFFRFCLFRNVSPSFPLSPSDKALRTALSTIKALNE